MSSFAQVDKPSMAVWVGFPTISTARVWFVLVQRADRGNRVVVSDADLMVSAKVSLRGMRRAFADLKRMKFIEREGGVIHLNSTIIWGGRREDMVMARLQCAVVFPDKKKSKTAS